MKKIIEQALKYWKLEQISYAMERIESTVLDRFKNTVLREAFILWVLLRFKIVV